MLKQILEQLKFDLLRLSESALVANSVETLYSRVVLMTSVTIMFLPFLLLLIHIAWTVKKRFSFYVPLKYIRGICKSRKSKMVANGQFFIYRQKITLKLFAGKS